MFGIAYRMLGSVADAEDILQDAYLRWHASDRAAVDNPRAYMSRIVTRLCLDRLRALRRRREEYVGQWLPDPLLEDAGMAVQPPEHIDRDVSVALMLALERLSPLERAAFILHDVFDMSFGEVAASIGRTEATCRQLATRARAHVADARPRFALAKAEGERLVQAFFRAARAGDEASLRDVLADAVVLHSDGGGRKSAVRNLLTGYRRVAGFFLGLAAKGLLADPVWSRPATINGHPGLVTVERDGTLQTLAAEIRDGRIQAIYVTRNPDKLAHLLADLPREIAERVTSGARAQSG